MVAKRTIEVFSAGCPVCLETIEFIERLACPSCDVAVLDVHQEHVAGQAKALGVRAVPAVAVDGRLLDCCASGPTTEALREAGIGQPL